MELLFKIGSEYRKYEPIKYYCLHSRILHYFFPDHNTQAFIVDASFLNFQAS